MSAEGLEAMTALFNDILDKGTTPSQWRQGDIVSIFKAGAYSGVSQDIRTPAAIATSTLQTTIFNLRTSDNT